MSIFVKKDSIPPELLPGATWVHNITGEFFQILNLVLTSNIYSYIAGFLITTRSNTQSHYPALAGYVEAYRRRGYTMWSPIPLTPEHLQTSPFNIIGSAWGDSNVEFDLHQHGWIPAGNDVLVWGPKYVPILLTIRRLWERQKYVKTLKGQQ